MNGYIEVKPQDIKQIIAATFPAYRKKKVVVKACHAVSLSNLNWSGGSRSEYRACTLTGREVPIKQDLHSPTPWSNSFEGLEIPIPEGFCIVECGVFCGKQATMYISVNPADMPKFITS